MDPITLSKINSAQKALEGRIKALETAELSVVTETFRVRLNVKKAATSSPSALKIYSQTIEVPLVGGVSQPISVSASDACVIYSVIVAFEKRSIGSYFYLPDFLLKIDGNTYFSGNLGDGQHATYGFADRNLYEYYKYDSSRSNEGYISYPLGISPDIIFPSGDNNIWTNPANNNIPEIIAYPIYCVRSFSMSSGTKNWGSSETKAATISLLYGVSTL